MDVILTKKDVNRVKIRARLVVLSCCHSAHGKIKAEGVVGIARAYFGCRCSLCSSVVVGDS